MNTQQKIAPCLWFETDAAEAASFYVSLFPDAYIARQMTSPVDWPGGQAGDVIVVDFVLAGQAYWALNGGANENAAFNESVSLSVACEDQAEIDRYWDALSGDGGEPILCGWLKDRYGLRWQIVPRALTAMLMDPGSGESAARHGGHDADGEARRREAAGGVRRRSVSSPPPPRRGATS